MQQPWIYFVSLNALGCINHCSLPKINILGMYDPSIWNLLSWGSSSSYRHKDKFTDHKVIWMIYLAKNTVMYIQCTCTLNKCFYYMYIPLRNRKHVLCFYRVIETRVKVWENKKCYGNTSHRWVFPQLFRLLSNFHENMFPISFRKHSNEKSENNLLTDYKKVNSLCSHHQRVLVLRFYQVIETRFLINQRAYFF